MQRISTFIGGVLAVVAVVALAIFALQNTQSVQMSFLGATFASAPSVVALAAALVALLVAFMLLLPSRVATGRRSSLLSTKYAQQEKDLTSLREAHTQLGAQHEIVLADFTRLRDEHGRILGERDDLLARLAPAAPLASAATAESPELVQDTATATLMERPIMVADPAQMAAEVGSEDVREDVIVAQGTPVTSALPVLDLLPTPPLAAESTQDVVLASTAPADATGAAASDLAANASSVEADVPEALMTAES